MVGGAVNFNFLKDWSIRNDNAVVRELLIQTDVNRQIEEKELNKGKNPTNWGNIIPFILIVGVVALLVTTGLNQMFNNTDLTTKVSTCKQDLGTCQGTQTIYKQLCPNIGGVTAGGTLNTGGSLHG